jgi:flavin reductase (DIM6/NTAB) family NADH-FMN oxidoreductase RutF
MSPDSDISIDEFKSAMSSWATGVSIITGHHYADTSVPIGIVCNSLASISLNEKLILWSVDKTSSSYPHWLTAKSFQVHFLAEDQRDLVARFAKKGGNKFENLEFETSELGNPILPGSSIRMECLTFQIIDTPDHTLIIGKLLNLENNHKSPLIYLHSSLSSSSNVYAQSDK